MCCNLTELLGQIVILWLAQGVKLLFVVDRDDGDTSPIFELYDGVGHYRDQDRLWVVVVVVGRFTVVKALALNGCYIYWIGSQSTTGGFQVTEHSKSESVSAIVAEAGKVVEGGGSRKVHQCYLSIHQAYGISYVAFVSTYYPNLHPHQASPLLHPRGSSEVCLGT